MGNILQQFKDLWSPLAPNQKISLILAAGLVTLAMIAIMLWAAKPDFQVMYRGLSAEDAGEIINKLEQKGVAYELGKGGDSIYVESHLVHKVRAELATDGVVPNGGSGKGFELFDSGAFGVSDFHQRTNFKRAVEGELSRTITQFRGVKSARVMVVMPENRLIIAPGQGVKAKASVFVDTSGGLESQAVNAIRHLVANSIQGLAINDVAVTDSMGVLLSAELTSDGLGGFTSDAMRLRQKYERDFAGKVQTMLDQVLGANQSVVRVAVDIDTSSVQTTSREFDPESAVVRQTQTEENSTKETDYAGGGGGFAGAAGNIPGAGQGGGTGGSSVAKDLNDTQEVTTQNFEINETNVVSVQNPGTISRVTAAVLVSKRYVDTDGELKEEVRTPEEINGLKQLVMNALGIRLKAGETIDDLVTLTESNFAPNPFENTQEVMLKEQSMDRWIETGKNSIGMVLGIGVIIFFLKMLKKNQPEKISVEVLKPEQMLQSRKLEDTSTVTPEMLNELIRQKPANIGVTLKDWIGEPEGNK